MAKYFEIYLVDTERHLRINQYAVVKKKSFKSEDLSSNTNSEIYEAGDLTSLILSIFIYKSEQ